MTTLRAQFGNVAGDENDSAALVEYREILSRVASPRPGDGERLKALAAELLIPVGEVEADIKGAEDLARIQRDADYFDDARKKANAERAELRPQLDEAFAAERAARAKREELESRMGRLSTYDATATTNLIDYRDRRAAVVARRPRLAGVLNAPEPQQPRPWRGGGARVA